MDIQKDVEKILVHANIEIAPRALELIVENSKKSAGKNESGYFTVDTADKLSELISRFLIEKDFESFAADPSNYNE